MDAGLALGLVLALSAAFLFNLSYMLQHGALDGGPDVDLLHPIQTVRGLFSDRPWLIGALAGASGFIVYTAALALAPLSLVQAFLASGLAFAVPMSVRIAGHVLTRRDTIGAILMTGALVLLAIGTGEHASTNSFRRLDLVICTAVTVLPAIALAFAIRGPRRAEALALSGGLFFGISDVLINALVGIAKGGIMELIASPWLIACVATNLAAFFTWQQSLQVGRAKVLAIVVLMTAATNVLAIGAGFAVYGDSLGSSPSWKAIHIACFVAIGLAVWLLAPAQAAITALEAEGNEGIA